MTDTATGRRAMLRLLGVGTIAALAVTAPARAQEQVKLFKVITSKDEIVIGVTPGELKAMGTGEDVKLIAQQILQLGQITVWQYAVGRDANGNLQMNPLRRVAILKNDTLRIEASSTQYKIAPPKP